MAYLLDANVFMQAKNLHYGLDFCPAFWDWLIASNAAERVFSIEKVGDEIDAGSDELTARAAQRGTGFFLKPDSAILPALGSVSTWATSQRYEPAAVSTFLQLADYYLVAHALAHGYTVGHPRDTPPPRPGRINDPQRLHRSWHQVRDALRDASARACTVCPGAATMTHTREIAFESVIEAHLLANGYQSVQRDGFDRERAIFPEVVLSFIRETQPAEWAKLEALLGPNTSGQVLTDLCKWMDLNGSLATLRHGFKCYGRTLRVAFFKAAHALNPEMEARYAANRLGITRQLHYSPRSEASLDLTLTLNGIPIATAELKNPLTGQTVEEGCRQYRQDRDPRDADLRLQAAHPRALRPGHRGRLHGHPPGGARHPLPAL